MEKMNTTPGSTHDYDVVIMGGGYAGLCQALHLVRKTPQLSIAIIEPKSVEALAAINKVGESTVEMAANFMVRELGLADYLAGTCPPKYGLNFHWPKDLSKSDTVDDYFSSWVPQGPKIPCYQLHRGRFENDVTKMVHDQGVRFYRARVKNLKLGEGETRHVIETRDEAGETQTLTARHLVDAAGRAFLIGRKKKTIRRSPDDLYGLDTISAWVRVKGVNPSILDAESHSKRSSVSGYFATNHWFGDGHWVWTIPIDGPDNVLSIGVVAHQQRIDVREMNSKEALFSFLEKHHKVVHEIACSGEVEDFKLLVRPAFKSTSMFGDDNTYTLGDSAYFGDPFYSMGTSSIAISVTSITDLITTVEAGGPDVQARRELIDKINLDWSAVAIHVVRDHYKHLGNASAMSWRIYFEYIWWFGFWVPMFMGRWHLDREFIETIDPDSQLGMVQEVYEDLTKMIEKGTHAGFADPYRVDVLGMDFAPPKHDAVDYLGTMAYEPQRLNIYRTLAKTLRCSASWLVQFHYKAFGLKGLLSPKVVKRIAFLQIRAVGADFLALRHHIKLGKRRMGALEEFDKEFEMYSPPPPFPEIEAPKEADARRKAS